ncbi:MAG: alginate export family protein [Gammaproteobacteria bacterium]|nr:alginate export family protein [Gammaproteobacteria bacterium]
MKKSLNMALVSSAIMGLTAVGYMQSVQADSIADAMSSGKATVDFRLRYEGVDQTGKSKKANAATLRSRLSYKTSDFQGFSLFMQGEHVKALVEDYNSKTNGKNDYPVIDDPATTDLNQAYIAYNMADTTVKLGRQEVVLDNARFVGNVGWRQNAQSFDALTVVNTALADTTIIYGYVNNINTITGGDTDTKTHLVNASYSGLPIGKVTGYGYFLELTDAPATSNSTLGLRFTGDTEVAEGTKLLYTAEFASQSSYKGGANTIEADYFFGEFGVNTSGITAKLGYEVLGGNGTYAFGTPLATKHGKNGWADMFLVTPKDGLVDLSFSISGKVNGVKLMAVYRNFSADNGSDKYGSEIDLIAVKKFSKNYKLMAKYASYSADTPDTNSTLSYKKDTDKLWLMGQATF